jgi:hypothetical protein
LVAETLIELLFTKDNQKIIHDCILALYNRQAMGSTPNDPLNNP